MPCIDAAFTAAREQDYSALKLTVGEYGLMKGGSWEGKGIVPSTEGVLPPEQADIYQSLPANEDAQVQAAVDKLEESSEPITPDDPVMPSDPTDTDSTTSTDTESTGETTTTTGE